jgi:hypothetical protein
MSQVPTKPTPATAPAESIEEKFERLAALWLAETAYVSSSSDLVAHSAFQEIVGMGPPVIPFLLRALANRTGHWHRALRRIAGADPVPPADRGNIDKAAEAWLRWGKENGRAASGGGVPGTAGPAVQGQKPEGQRLQLHCLCSRPQPQLVVA